MKKLFSIGIILLTFLSLPAAGFAASPWTKEPGYWPKIEEKAHFALTNIFLGWLDMFSEAEDASDDKKNAFAAFGKGFLHFPVLTVGGVLHLITFPFPQVDIPLPHNGVSV